MLQLMVTISDIGNTFISSTYNGKRGKTKSRVPSKSPIEEQKPHNIRVRGSHGSGGSDRLMVNYNEIQLQQHKSSIIEMLSEWHQSQNRNQRTVKLKSPFSHSIVLVVHIHIHPATDGDADVLYDRVTARCNSINPVTDFKSHIILILNWNFININHHYQFPIRKLHFNEHIMICFIAKGKVKN